MCIYTHMYNTHYVKTDFLFVVYWKNYRDTGATAMKPNPGESALVGSRGWSGNISICFQSARTERVQHIGACLLF